MALIMVDATMWDDRRDSSKKETTLDNNHTGYRQFLINPNRISDMKVHGTGSCFLFSENHRDRRENNSYMECNQTVAEIITAYNTAIPSDFITLPFYPHNDPDKTPVDTTLDIEDIAYFDAYNPDPDNYSWLIYNRKAFRRVEQLVGYNLEQDEDIVNTGTTTTTSSTSTTSSTDQ
jgi:hypothetical protein